MKTPRFRCIRPLSPCKQQAVQKQRIVLLLFVWTLSQRGKGLQHGNTPPKLCCHAKCLCAACKHEGSCCSSGSGDIEGSPQQHDHSEGIPEQHDDGEAIPEQHDGDAETQLPVSDAAMGFQAGSGTSAQR